MSGFDVDSDLIRRLAELLDETGLSEIEVGEGEHRVRVVRAVAAPAAANPAPAAAEAPATQATADADATHPGAVTSPMVGTVYTAPEPGEPPYVKVGDTVSEGQHLFVIEAMKVMNPIRAPRDGTVTRILVQNRDPVEYGDVLLILE